MVSVTPLLDAGDVQNRIRMDSIEYANLLGSIDGTNSEHTLIQYVPMGSGFALDVIGHGFTFKGIGTGPGASFPAGGVIEEFRFYTFGCTFAGLNLSVEEAAKAVTFEEKTAWFEQIFAGDDHITGSDKDDVLLAFAGDDSITAGLGRDRIESGAGRDTVSGGAGEDTIIDVGGANYLRGDDGNDSISGGADFDDINGNQGNDTASGGAGDDWVVGGKDNDVLNGDAGDDLVYGNLGADTCDGGDGNDIVRGGQDNDIVRGGAGNDYVSGDKGDDTVTGGPGADIFHTFGDAGIDRVLDFSLAEGDRVQLDPGTQYTVAQVGADTVISMTGGGQMILVGIQMNSLTPGWIFGA